MSRILRRPMFRGGRVDSRGTGITSGLSYQKGGRVGYFNGGSIYDNIAPYYTAPMPAKSGTGIQGILQGLYDIFNPSRATIEQRLKEANPPEFGPGSIEPFIKTRSYTERKEEFEKNEAERLEKEKQAEIERLVNEQLKNTNLNNNNDVDDTVIDKKTIIKENAELFKELLGSDKARGQDISDMLLSFAGQALKPEATVKTAFGEFAADEAKRPGRGRKIDDTAAAMAINAYIAGEKSAADLKKALDLKEAGLDMQQDILKERSLTSRINNDRTGRTVKQIVEGNTKEWMSDNKLSGVPNVVSSEDIKSPELLVNENINEVFIDETTKEVFIVLKGTSGKPTLQQLY